MDLEINERKVIPFKTPIKGVYWFQPYSKETKWLHLGIYALYLVKILKKWILNKTLNI